MHVGSQFDRLHLHPMLEIQLSQSRQLLLLGGDDRFLVHRHSVRPVPVPGGVQSDAYSVAADRDVVLRWYDAVLSVGRFAGGRIDRLGNVHSGSGEFFILGSAGSV